MIFSFRDSKFNIKRLVFFIIILLPIIIKAQRFNFKHYSVENGLPYVQIFTIFQDSKGYLWSGGYGGLSKFNGKEFKNYSPKNGLANHYVNAITEDKQQRIIVGTIDGLSVFNKNGIANYHLKDGLPSKNITSLCVDIDNTLWIGTSKGLCILSNNQLHLVEGFSNKKINCLFYSISSGLWVGTTEGLYHYTNKVFKQIESDAGLLNNQITSLTENLISKELFIGTSNGLKIYNSTTQKIITYHVINGLLDEEINALIATNTGEIWIGSKSGLVNFTNNHFSYFTINNDNNSNIVRSLYMDYENNLWIGTHNGLYQYRDKGFMSYGKQEGLGGAFVYQIINDKQNNIWITTENNGVFKYNNGYFKNYSSKEGLNTINVVSAICIDEGEMWFGTNKGIISFKNNAFKPVSTKLESPISCFFIDTKKNIWVGGLNTLCCFKKSGNSCHVIYYSIPTSIKDFGVWSINEDKEGNIWAGTYLAGLYKLQNNVFVNQQSYFQTEIESVLEIEFDTDGIMYAATLNGVLMFNPITRASKVISENEGLISELVYSIKLTKNQKYLWSGTNQGISRIDVTKLKQNVVDIVSYNKADGFEGVECNTHGIYEDEESNVWFGTVNGLVKYSAKEFKQNDNPSKTNISRIQLGYQDTALEQNCKLAASSNNISFFVDGISLTNSSKVLYTYKLEGFDTSYSPTTANAFAKYDNLPSGKYIFKVKSCNSEGMWNIEPTTFSFQILTPFYKSWWFILVVLSGISGTVYIFFQYRLKKAHRKQQRIFERQIEISKSELKALRAQMNPHFVFNSLNSIQHYILNSKSEEAVKYLNKFAKLIRIILHNSEKQMVTINEDIESVTLYLELERMRFDNKFDYTITFENDIDGDYDEIPPMIIQPYLENAILHGINPKEGNGHIEIKIEQLFSFIKITITDDGVGRAKANALKSLQSPSKHKSLGMKITEDRLRLLNNMQQSQLNVNIIDLYDSKNEAIGTQVELYVPYIK